MAKMGHGENGSGKLHRGQLYMAALVMAKVVVPKSAMATWHMAKCGDTENAPWRCCDSG